MSSSAFTGALPNRHRTGVWSATRSKSFEVRRSTIEVSEMPDTIGRGDPLYLFLCHLEWHRTRNPAAYNELLAGLDDTDPDIRVVAEVLLHRHSPRRVPTRTSAAGKSLD